MNAEVTTVGARQGPARTMGWCSEGRAAQGGHRLGAERHQQSSERICVEHANAEHKQWRTLQRFLGRREYFDESYRAVAGLNSDRTAER
ncbi:hypothetical protein [Streptomyces sp. C10]|uniref:hypothetical protein n=1 Tax=Streptomyces sp. C10 TaxID=531941 RepID=UPI0039810CD7